MAEAAASGQAPGRARGAGCEAAVRDGPQRPRRGAGPARSGPGGWLRGAAWLWARPPRPRLRPGRVGAGAPAV